MKLYGSALDEGVQRFFLRHFKLSKSGDVLGIPVFENETEVHIGGFKGFYTVAEDVDIDVLQKALAGIRTGKKKYFRLSCIPPISPGRNIHSMLVLPSAPLGDEERLKLYDKKTRNEVRKSRASVLKTSIEDVRFDMPWYELYTRRIGELGSVPKEQTYFSELRESCAQGTLKLVCAWDGDTLAGFNFVVCTPPYLVLTQSASLKEYWPQYVNDLLYDETIRFGIEHGYTRIDFGASSLGDRTHNHFKEGFGGQTRFFLEPYVHPLNRYTRIAGDMLQMHTQRFFRMIGL